MEKEKERANRIHILVVPLPVQGHINPMLQFSKRLASKGLRVTLVTISSNTEAIETQLCKVKIEPIHATSEEEEEAGNNVENKVLWFQTILSRRLPQLILKQENDGYPIICLVYDSAMPWVLDTAKGLGIFGASFFTHSCAVGAVYYNVHEGLLRVPLKEPTISLPGLPLLEPQDLPSFIYDPGSYPSFLNLVVSRFSNITGADWIFFNTFHGLEKELPVLLAVSWGPCAVPEYKSRNGDSRQEAPQVCASVHTWDWQGQGGSNHIRAKHDQQTCRGLDPKGSCCHWRGNLQVLSWEGFGISNSLFLSLSLSATRIANRFEFSELLSRETSRE